MCTHETHAALKATPERVRRETTPLSEQEIDGEVIGYLRNCHCGSTIMLTPTQHAVLLTTSEGT